jgi:polyhydroxybutyrate depolymerase
VRRLLPPVALALAVAGCSDGGNEDTEPTPAPTTTEAAEAGPDPSTGCGRPSVAAGETSETVTSGGRERAYFLHVPPAHDGTTPLPLVVDFHGYSEGGEIHVAHSALGPYGDEQGFVTITPDSGYEVPRWDVNLESEDVAMVGDLLDQAEATLCIDTRRIFVTGLSNGAFMTSAVACAYSDRVAAVAPVAGIRDIGGCSPERPVPVVAFHGTDDGFVTYEGGFGQDAADLPAPDGSGQVGDLIDEDEPRPPGPSIPEITTAWAERNGCGPEPAEEPVADDVTLLSWDCPAGAEVELYRVEGGGHTWPGSEFSGRIENIVGTTTFSISANEVMWEFFRTHPLPA